ncbi:hypothetical protein CIPAW_11G064200 [Carya illinoinensis]|uniref:Endonuclease/exonuclease/phosphatase domain-containing protein n=2 Tax=Carya illinoinensis TaxID=32201 RepID=A0A8T1P2K5_CARIL|nr:hypothetical protein CIPAW_11G064200 [Carya illinoinensis]
MSKASKLERLKRRLGMEGCFVIDSVGKKGGLALYWRNSEEVEIKSYSTWHINAEVNEEGQGIKWLFTGFYGHPETGKMMFSWDLLRRLKPREQEPWCVVGDFNEILIQTEKVGGRQRAELQMNQFREALEDTMLYDLGCRNGFYTWSNRHNDHSFTKERLDRCVANNKWRDMFKSAGVQGLSARSSDHLPLLVLTRGNEVRQRRGQFPFRFEASWVKEEDCEEKIKQEWVRGQQSTDFVKKVQTRLKFCSGMLVRSFKRKDKERTSEIDQITRKIKEVQEDLGHHNIEELKSLQKQVGGLLEQEDIKWRQRAKRNWYSLGDKNTRSFHECANQRRRRNRIYTVVDSRGFLKEGEEEIEKAFHEHFTAVYKSVKPKEDMISKCSITVEENVTCEMNDFLEKAFKREEP